MILTENVPLATLTTLKVGGAARFVASCKSEEDIREAIAFAKAHGLPYVALGAGSNLVAADEGFEGVVLKVEIGGIETRAEGDRVVVEVGAGEDWNQLVEQMTLQGLWGIENLAGIPGTVGAAPMQNIGAYGVEIKEVIAWVDVVNAHTGEVIRFSNEECAFGYRESRFKKEPHHIITRVALRLRTDGTPRLSYGDLEAARARGEALETPHDIAEAVRAIRSKKFPDLAVYGTAGSFFKNPIISEEAYRELCVRYPGLPGFPAGADVKISLAWILDKVLNLRGFRLGKAHLFERQPLVLVADTDATTQDVNMLANEVIKRVYDATGITIEREVRALPRAE